MVAFHKILPLESLIHFHRVNFMYNYQFKKLPFSFAELWLFNSERNPNRVLGNANDYYIPQPRIELVKILLLFTFPAAWNSENVKKINNFSVFLSFFLSFFQRIPVNRQWRT
jgi:hypothetical protein